MRDYGIVSPRFWLGETGKSLRGDPDAQVLALYLMTSPHSTMIGVFHCPILYMAHETGIPLEGASKGLRRLIEAGFCEYDEASETIFVTRMAAYQIGESLSLSDKRVSGIRKEVEKMPKGPIKSSFLRVYGDAFHLQKERAEASPSKAPSKPHRSQEQEQEQEQDKEHGGSTPSKPRTQSASRFAEFWQAWPAGPRKQARAECEKKWKARGLDSLADEIVGHVRSLLKTKQFQEFTPSPLTYLNQRRWEDGAPSGGDEQAESNLFRGAL